jgi:hypothetical protein
MKRSTAVAGIAGAAVGVTLLSCLAFAMQPSVDAEGQGPAPTPEATPSATLTPSPSPSQSEVLTGPTNEPTEPEPIIGEAQGPQPHSWVQPCTDWIADHGGVCIGEPIDWGFSSGETLVCGQDAKPALDYRADGIGWWAYCEPALVDQGPANLPSCIYEDGSGQDICIWRGDIDGNGEGLTYIVMNGEAYYLDGAK